MSMQQHIPSPDFSVPDFSAPELAKKLHVSVTHVRDLLAEGQIPSYKVGTAVRIPAEAVDALRSGQPANDDDLNEQIRRIVDAAPRLTPSQRDKLAALLAVDADEPKTRRRSRSGGAV